MTVPSPLSVGIRAAAKMIGVSDRHLHGLAITGDVPSVKIGHRRLFVVDDLKAWLAQKSKGGQAL